MEMKIIVRSERGSVSIYLIIIFVAIFLFNAVLIDYVRVMAANKQTENALKTGLRSVLSSYDTQLKEGYGLYGKGQEDGNAILLDVLEMNLDHSPGYFNLLDTQIEYDNVFLDFGHQLSYHPVFEQQILEEMKYKAPIQFSLEVVDRLKPLSLAMKEASAATKVLRDLKSLYEQREAHLIAVTTSQKNALYAIDENFRQGLDSNNPIVSQFGSYVSAFYEYQEAVDEENNQKDEEIENKEERIDFGIIIGLKKEIAASTMNQYCQQSNESLDSFEAYLRQHELEINKALKEIEHAKVINKQMKDRIAESEREGEQYNKVQQDRTSGNEMITSISQKDVDEIKGVRDSLQEKTIYNEEFFNETIDRLHSQQKEIEELVNSVKILKDQYSKSKDLDPSGDRDSSENQKKASDLHSAFQTVERQHAAYTNKASEIVHNQEKQMDTVQKGRNKSLEEEYGEESNLGLDEIKQMLDNIKRLKSKADDYETVGGYVEEYVKINQEVLAQNTLSSTAESPEDAAHEAMLSMDKLFSNTADLLLNFRNNLYVNEYAFDKFTHIDPNILKEISSIQSFEDIEDKLDLSNQEIEYILYGLETPGENIGAAFAEIFAFRLAINTMEAFPECVGVGHPFAILLCVISKGLTHTMNDMRNLLNGMKIQLLKKVSVVSLSYKDHLRLFLLLHTNNNYLSSMQLSRMQSLIHFKSGKNLHEVPTYVQGSVTTSIQLWFLPGVMKALKYVGVVDGNIEGRRYKINKTAVMAY
jgi:hypothetical protein